MDRSLFPEGVEIHEVNLTRESQAKAAAILRRHLDTNQMGIVAGMALTVASDPLRVKVGAGRAYTPSGELISLTSNADNIPLADYTNGALNYVVAIYTEVYSDPQAHEDLGITFNTLARGGYRIRAYREADYNSLPPTDPNLNNDAIDRIVLLGIVTARGNSNLTSGDIFSTVAYTPVLAIDQPVNVTGVQIIKRSPSLRVGTGILTYIAEPTAMLSWQAPGDTSPGNSVMITGSGAFELASDTEGYEITVWVLVSRLPEGTSTITDNLGVVDLYSQTVPSFSARDEHHRHMVGSGTPTERNPHGLTADDIGLTNADTEGAIALHRKMQHPAMLGIHNTPNAGVAVIDGLGSPDLIVVGQFTDGDYAFVGGKVVQAITGSPASLPNVDANIHPGLYEVYIDAAGKVGMSRRVKMAGANDAISAMATFVQIVDIADTWVGQAGSVTVMYDSANGGSIALNGRAATPLGASRGVIRVYADDLQSQWMDLYVYPDKRPTSSNIGETWRFTDPIDPNRIDSLLLAMVHFSGNAGGFLGYGGTDPNAPAATGLIVDKRYASFESGASTHPGVKTGVDPSRKQGYLRLSKENEKDIIIDYDTAAKLLTPAEIVDVTFPTAPADQPGLLTRADWNTFNGKQNALGFTPIQQGGGTSQYTNKIYLGWDGAALRAQVDATDLGRLVSESALSLYVSKAEDVSMRRYQKFRDPGLSDKPRIVEVPQTDAPSKWVLDYGTPSMVYNAGNTNPDGYALVVPETMWRFYTHTAGMPMTIKFGCNVQQLGGEYTNCVLRLDLYEQDTGQYITGPDQSINIQGYSDGDFNVISGALAPPRVGWWRFAFHIYANHWHTYWSAPYIEYYMGYA